MAGDPSYSLTLLSAYHAYAADYFLLRVVEMEGRHQHLWESEPLYRHRALVMASVLSSVAFFEARINEVFEEASGKWPSFLCAGLSRQGCEALGKVWNRNAARRPPIEKYRLALSTTGRPGIEGALCENVVLLMRLRNHLVHFDGRFTLTPKWDEGPVPQGEQTLLERSLRGKFALCTLSGLDLFFPDQCLGSGCAMWAVKSAGDYVTEFSDRLGVVTPSWPTPVAQGEEDDN